MHPGSWTKNILILLCVQDPNERRRLALAEIDKAPFGWYHVRAVVVAGIGFFTDAYDVCESPPPPPPTAKQRVACITDMSCTDFCGQFDHGNAGDCLLEDW